MGVETMMERPNKTSIQTVTVIGNKDYGRETKENNNVRMIPFIIQPRENSSRSSNSSSLKDTNDRKGKTNSNINSIFRKCSSGSCDVGGVGVGSGVGMNNGIEHHPKLG